MNSMSIITTATIIAVINRSARKNPTPATNAISIMAIINTTKSVNTMILYFTSHKK